MTAAQAYRHVLAECTAALSLRPHRLDELYERLHGAYQVAVMVGLREDVETPAAWYARFEKEAA